MPTARHRAAFSIIELLIALIIISVLVAMVILIASQRANEARLETARADMRLIAEAEQQASIDLGYFLRLYVLDDITGDPSAGDLPPTFGDGTGDRFDTFQEELSNTRNPEGDTFFIVPDFGSLPGNTGSDPPGDLVRRAAIVNNESFIGVGLPYISYQREYEDPATGDVFNIPRDPWGQPYVLFTRQGMINDTRALFLPDQGLLGTTADIVGAGLPPLPTELFDRFTIISFGPNALPGDGSGTTGVGADGDFGEDDDLVLQLN